MKKSLMFIISLAMISAMTACENNISDNRSENNNSDNIQTEATESIEASTAFESETDSDVVNETAEENSKILVCFFSFPETDSTDASSGASRVVIDGEMKGAMQYMAEIISDTTGGDVFRIETVQNYPGTHEPLVDQAADEKADSARPELSTHIENLDVYDTIFIGYPNWWGDMPICQFCPEIFQFYVSEHQWLLYALRFFPHVWGSYFH